MFIKLKRVERAPSIYKGDELLGYATIVFDTDSLDFRFRPDGVLYAPIQTIVTSHTRPEPRNSIDHIDEILTDCYNGWLVKDK